MEDYRERIADGMIEKALRSHGAVLVEGPLRCGKTETATRHAGSVLSFRGPDAEALLYAARNDPAFLTEGDAPRLIDGWQGTPEIWGAVRSSVQERGENGLYIMTGPTPRDGNADQTRGDGRIATVAMQPMSLYESGESTGEVSIAGLFDDPEGFVGCRSDLTWDDLAFAICRGGWPECVCGRGKDDPAGHMRILYGLICGGDGAGRDERHRSPAKTDAVLRACARETCLASSGIHSASDAAGVAGVSRNTFSDYVGFLKIQRVLEDVPAWRPPLRSETTVRSSPERGFADPSIAAAALGLKPKDLRTDFLTLNRLFKSLCMRDVRVYSSPLGGTVSCYRERYGLGVDCVLRLDDGRYALMDFEMGAADLPKDVRRLCEIERLIRAHDGAEEDTRLRIGPPTFKAVLTASQYGYRTKEGVLVISIGCLRD